MGFIRTIRRFALWTAMVASGLPAIVAAAPSQEVISHCKFGDEPFEIVWPGAEDGGDLVLRSARRPKQTFVLGEALAKGSFPSLCDKGLALALPDGSIFIGVSYPMGEDPSIGAVIFDPKKGRILARTEGPIDSDKVERIEPDGYVVSTYPMGDFGSRAINEVVNGHRILKMNERAFHLWVRIHSVGGRLIERVDTKLSWDHESPEIRKVMSFEDYRNRVGLDPFMDRLPWGVGYIEGIREDGAVCIHDTGSGWLCPGESPSPVVATCQLTDKRLKLLWSEATGTTLRYEDVALTVPAFGKTRPTAIRGSEGSACDGVVGTILKDGSVLIATSHDSQGHDGELLQSLVFSPHERRILAQAGDLGSGTLSIRWTEQGIQIQSLPTIDGRSTEDATNENGIRLRSIAEVSLRVWSRVDYAEGRLTSRILLRDTLHGNYGLESILKDEKDLAAFLNMDTSSDSVPSFTYLTGISRDGRKCISSGTFDTPKRRRHWRCEENRIRHRSP